jgi:hypothetical protein
MAHYHIEHITEQADTIYVEVDRRFNLAIVRTEAKLEIRVYPLTEGEIWDMPFITFIVDEAEVAGLEAEMLAINIEGEGK